MNCRIPREQIALAAAGCLSASAAAELQSHVEQCSGCRAVFQQYQRVVSSHEAASSALQKVSPPVMSRRPIPSSRPSPSFRELFWKWMVPISAVASIMLVISRAPWHPKQSLTIFAPVVQTLASRPASPSPTSVASYKNALEISGDEGLDKLLEKDAFRLLPPNSKNSLADLGFGMP